MSELKKEKRKERKKNSTHRNVSEVKTMVLFFS